jgi:hypothetical protein
MGMPVTVNVVDVAAEAGALDRVFEEFSILDRTFSPFLQTSAVSCDLRTPASSSTR